jgi:hypothetical protein
MICCYLLEFFSRPFGLKYGIYFTETPFLEYSKKCANYTLCRLSNLVLHVYMFLIFKCTCMYMLLRLINFKFIYEHY